MDAIQLLPYDQSLRILLSTKKEIKLAVENSIDNRLIDIEEKIVGFEEKIVEIERKWKYANKSKQGLEKLQAAVEILLKNHKKIVSINSETPPTITILIEEKWFL